MEVGDDLAAWPIPVEDRDEGEPSSGPGAGQKACEIPGIRFEVRVSALGCGEVELRVTGHIYVSERAGYDDLPEDGHPRHDRGGAR